jgi:hypothetical protein
MAAPARASLCASHCETAAFSASQRLRPKSWFRCSVVAAVMSSHLDSHEMDKSSTFHVGSLLLDAGSKRLAASFAKGGGHSFAEICWHRVREDRCREPL